MSGTAIPLAQFAQQLAVAGAGVDISGWTAAIASGGALRSLESTFADAPFIEWFGVCGLGGDDTAVFNKAVQSGIPFRLGPKTYVVNGSWSTGKAPFLSLRGYIGISRLLRLEGADSGAWLGLECAIVDIEGVIFDANGSSVSANTWSVLTNSSVQTARLRQCAFRNNSGTLGRGLAIIGTGAANSSTNYLVESCEFSGNSSDGCGFFEVSGLTINNCRSFGNGGSGIAGSVIGTPSVTRLNQNVLVSGNLCWGNALDGINLGTLNPSGSKPPVYNLTQPSVANVSVTRNMIAANGSYGIQAYGDYLDVSGNQITQLAKAAGGIVMTARHSRIAENILNVPGVYIGIDTGGCSDCEVSHNTVAGAQIGLNPGGSQYVTVTGNKLSGCGIGITIYDCESDGNGVPFPTPLSGMAVERNTIILGDSATGISVLDGGTGITIVENYFFSTDSGVSANQALILRSNSVLLRGNTWNGLSRVDLNPDANNVLEIPDVFDAVRITSAGQVIDSFLPISVAGSIGQVSFLTVIEGGSGYTTASVLISGAGTGAQATAMIVGGSVIGFRVISNGSGYDPITTACSIEGDGTGAQAQVVVGTPIQANRRQQLLTGFELILRQAGQFVSQANSTLQDLVLVSNSAAELVENGGGWLVTGFYPAALLQSNDNGAVTLVSPIGSPLSLAPGTGGNLVFVNLPTSPGGLPAGAIWRNDGVLNIILS